MFDWRALNWDQKYIWGSRRVHAKKPGAHINVPSKKVCEHYFIHVVQIQMGSGKSCTKEILCAHRLRKIRGNIDKGLISCLDNQCMKSFSCCSSRFPSAATGWTEQAVMLKTLAAAAAEPLNAINFPDSDSPSQNRSLCMNCCKTIDFILM